MAPAEGVDGAKDQNPRRPDDHHQGHHKLRKFDEQSMIQTSHLNNIIHRNSERRDYGSQEVVCKLVRFVSKLLKNFLVVLVHCRVKLAEDKEGNKAACRHCAVGGKPSEEGIEVALLVVGNAHDVGTGDGLVRSQRRKRRKGWKVRQVLNFCIYLLQLRSAGVQRWPHPDDRGLQEVGRAFVRQRRQRCRMSSCQQDNEG
mmetsp:Transcript_49663/g.115909  ORF Transcript_49663/g.115909 Transcript_49663/m.115909 type:complete len:200 (+) Transcript_49663:1797-2396(+)